MPRVFLGHGENRSQVVVSLCDYSGNWPKPWHEAGHTVLCYDLKHGDDVTTLTPQQIWEHIAKALGEGVEADVIGVLCAPPCTDFTVSGAQYWAAKDRDGRTEASLRVLDACVDLAEHFEVNFGAWWILENPVGRIPKLRPDMGKPHCYVDPYQFAHLADNVDAERYTKKTGLWGSFNLNGLLAQVRQNGGPIRVCAQGSWIQKLGGKSERTKELRSMTPVGLARACYVAQSSDTYMRNAA